MIEFLIPTYKNAFVMCWHNLWWREQACLLIRKHFNCYMNRGASEICSGADEAEVCFSKMSARYTLVLLNNLSSTWRITTTWTNSQLCIWLPWFSGFSQIPLFCILWTTEGVSMVTNRCYIYLLGSREWHCQQMTFRFFSLFSSWDLF